MKPRGCPGRIEVSLLLCWKMLVPTGLRGWIRGLRKGRGLTSAEVAEESRGGGPARGSAFAMCMGVDLHRASEIGSWL